MFSKSFSIKKPFFRIGLPKGKSGVLACYEPKKNIIYIRDRKVMRNPFIILHELYHVTRIFMGKHRGTERKANEFARQFLRYAIDP